MRLTDEEAASLKADGHQIEVVKTETSRCHMDRIFQTLERGSGLYPPDVQWLRDYIDRLTEELKS